MVTWLRSEFDSPSMHVIELSNRSRVSMVGKFRGGISAIELL